MLTKQKYQIKTKLRYYVEICCDYCGEAIHTHFSCPICKNDQSSTDCYGDLIEEFKDGYLGKENSFRCEGCNTRFIISKKFLRYYINHEVPEISGMGSREGELNV